MEMSGQVHARSLYPRENALVPITQSERFWDEENLLPLPGFQPRIIQLVA